VALERFAAERLAELLPRQRWFASKGRPIASVAVRDAASLGGRAPGAVLTLLDVVFEQGPGETYVVPLLGLADGRDDATVLGQAEADGVPLRVVEPFDDSGFCGALLRAFAEGLRLPARHGTVRFVRAGAFPAGTGTAGLVARRLKGEQSNTSVVYGDALILKTFRRPEAGVNPEHEMTGLKRQVEAAWASERMANAVLRERINDVAGEVVRVAHALEGLGSPIETMLAGKATELDAMTGGLSGGNGIDPTSSMPNGGDDSKGSLARRIRSLQKRAARVTSAGGT